MIDSKTIKQISKIKEPNERKVAYFLKILGLTPIDFNPIIYDDNFQIGEIDSIFLFNDYFLLVEVSKKNKQTNMKKNFFFSKWSDAYNLRKLRKKYKECNLETKNVFRIYFDMVKDNPVNHAGIDHMTKRRKRNKVVYLEKYKEFSNIKNKTLARTQFLKWLSNY